MSEYTNLICNSQETAEEVMRYLQEQQRQDEEAPAMDYYVEGGTLKLVYRGDSCRFREAIDAQLLGFRDGYCQRRKSPTPVDSASIEIEELRKRIDAYAEYERPIVVKDFKRLLELYGQAYVQGGLSAIDRIVQWLNRRCDYAPPCGKCLYCSVAMNLSKDGWVSK